MRAKYEIIYKNFEDINLTWEILSCRITTTSYYRIVIIIIKYEIKSKVSENFREFIISKIFSIKKLVIIFLYYYILNYLNL